MIFCLIDGEEMNKMNNNIGKTLQGILIQFLVMFILGYFWVEKDIVKALELAILTTLITSVLDFILSIFNKK